MSHLFLQHNNSPLYSLFSLPLSTCDYDKETPNSWYHRLVFFNPIRGLWPGYKGPAIISSWHVKTDMVSSILWIFHAWQLPSASLSYSSDFDFRVPSYILREIKLFYKIFEDSWLSRLSLPFWACPCRRRRRRRGRWGPWWSTRRSPQTPSWGRSQRRRNRQRCEPRWRLATEPVTNLQILSLAAFAAMPSPRTCSAHERGDDKILTLRFIFVPFLSLFPSFSCLTLICL